MKSFWFNILLFMIVFAAIEFGYTVQHELVHQSIYEDYGIESTIVYHPLKGFTNGVFGETIAYYEESKCPKDCTLAHQQNEIVGYNVHTLVAGIFLCLFLWFIITESRRVEDGRTS